MCGRCGKPARVLGSLVLICGLCASQLVGQDEHRDVPHQPDTGAEWAYNPAAERRPFAIGSNTRSVYVYPDSARGWGTAFDASIRLDFARKA